MEPALSTSQSLQALLADAPADRVSLRWIVEHLRDRSFGVLMLVLALVGLAPGIASVSGFVLAIPALQMIAGRSSPMLPRRLGERTLATPQFARWMTRAIRFLNFIETRLPTRKRAAPWRMTRLIGVVDFIMALAIIYPLPFAYIAPTVAIILIACAQIEESIVLLAVGFVVAAASLAMIAALTWSIVAAAGWLVKL